LQFENSGRASEVTQLKAQPGLVALCLSSLAGAVFYASDQRNEIAAFHSPPGEYVDQSARLVIDWGAKFSPRWPTHSVFGFN
jgi:hypothetical protein